MTMTHVLQVSQAVWPDPQPSQGVDPWWSTIDLLGSYDRDWRIASDRARNSACRRGHTHSWSCSARTSDMAFTRLSARPKPLAEPRRGRRDPRLLSAPGGRRRRSRAGGVDASALPAEPGATVTVAGVDAHFSADAVIVEDASAPNVVAVLRGSDPELANTYVVFSAHMDHVGIGTANATGDSIYNGADDDASGTSALVEMAQAFSMLDQAPRRSLIFLNVSGEEKGLLGSRWFTDHPTVPIDRIVANVNMDMIARNAPDSIVVIGQEYSSLGPLVQRVATEHPDLGLTVSVDIWPEERFFFRSDHFNFARLEIPALFFFAGVHEDYHQPSDQVEKLDTDKAARVARLAFWTAHAIADSPETPVWTPQGLEGGPRSDALAGRA